MNEQLRELRALILKRKGTLDLNTKKPRLRKARQAAEAQNFCVLKPNPNSQFGVGKLIEVDKQAIDQYCKIRKEVASHPPDLSLAKTTSPDTERALIHEGK